MKTQYQFPKHLLSTGQKRKERELIFAKLAIQKYPNKLGQFPEAHWTLQLLYTDGHIANNPQYLMKVLN